MNQLELQIKSTFEQAFWDKLDHDIYNRDLTHANKLLVELKEILKSFVPSRKDIHEQIENALGDTVEWHHQKILVEYIEKFQQPDLDWYTREWKKRLPMKLSDFLKQYYSHIKIVYDQVIEMRTKLANGENIFVPDPVENHGGAPGNIKTGK